MANQWVYFIRAMESGRIKIGTAANPARRMAELQTGCPEQLELLGAVPGGRSLEVRIHADFAHDRLHGEWFTCSDRLLWFVGDTLGWSRRTPEQLESARKAAAAWQELAG